MTEKRGEYRIASGTKTGEMTLKKAIDTAEKEWQRENGKCTMCAIGDEPVNGMHGEHYCGNYETCMFCHNAGMEYGDRCAVCGRIEKHDF